MEQTIVIMLVLSLVAAFCGGCADRLKSRLTKPERYVTVSTLS